MSTADRNPLDFNLNFEAEASDLRIAIVRSQWNDDITRRLLDGAVETLKRFGIADKHLRVIDVPGSFELPLGAQMLLEECDPLPGAVICLGCIIRGETSHFEYVAQTVSSGIKDVGLKFNLPVVFGVLTDDNKQQSLDRSGGKYGNKGEEAAVTAVQMAVLQRRLRRK